MSNTYPELTETSFPDSLDVFSRMSDISYSDISLVDQYYVYMNAGNINAAQQILTDNPALKNKIINAAVINKFLDSVCAVERFFKSDVETYIDAKALELGEEINEFTYKGEYSSSVTYSKWNIVTYSGAGYICIQEALGMTPSDSSDYWQLIAAKGDQGVSGTGLAFCGSYSSVRSYTKDDCVTSGNCLWCALQPSAGQPLTEGIYWTCIYDGSLDLEEHNTSTSAHSNLFNEKISRVTNAVAGNVPSFDRNGNLIDSGKTAENIKIIAIDSELSDTSENPLQNKAIKSEFDKKLDKTGGTLTGALVAQSNEDYTIYQVRNVALGTSAAVPTGTGNLLGVYS